MDAEKISISLDEVNSERVDAEIRRQDIAARMSAHQEQVEANTPTSRRFNAGVFRKAVVYMAVFGLASAILGWGVGEVVQYNERNHPYNQFKRALQVYNVFSSNNPHARDWEWLEALDNLQKSGNKEFCGNPYLQRSFWAQSEWKIKNEVERIGNMEGAYRRLNNLWYVLIGLLIGVGLAMAEPMVGHNGKSAAFRSLIGAVLGALGGFICSLFVDDIYRFFGGGQEASSFMRQMFARGVGWSILGGGLAIAPGIAMYSGKKFTLGLAGGAIGGLLGGILFDPICQLSGSDIPARFVNILGLGVGAAVATALLEEAAKQGWLKVATGVITGKQFILYRNPTVIGSSPKAEIYLFKDPTVMPRHAAINGVGGEFLLTALNNSTVFLNGKPVRQQRLQTGDQIRVGNTIFLFGARRLKTNMRK